MAKTIGNPLSWGARMLGAAGHDIGEVARELGGDHAAPPEVRTITTSDIRAALRLGLADFSALRTDVIVACLLYPIIGACVVWAAHHRNLVPLIFPLVSGFALVGPAAAVGLYEMSRKREAGKSAGWADAFAVLQSPRFGAIFALAIAHFCVFFLWLLSAYVVFLLTMGPDVPASATAFLGDVLTTGEGWAMMLIGIPLGRAFRASRARDQRRVLPSSNRPGGGAAGRCRHLRQGRAAEPGDRGDLGGDRRRVAGSRVDPAASGARRGPAGAGPCDMASLSPRGGGHLNGAFRRLTGRCQRSLARG